MSKIRTFVAVELADDVRVRASQLIDKLRGTDAKVKWVERDRMHITLKFLGDVDEREVNNVCLAVKQSAAGIGSFAIHCAGANAFPDLRRPRTPWLGVTEGADELSRLQKKIEDALFELGFPKEARRFHAHLTLGRARSGGRSLHELSQLLKNFAEYDAGTTVVDEVVVMSSFLEPSGPVYHPLARIDLSGTTKGQLRS